MMTRIIFSNSLIINNIFKYMQMTITFTNHIHNDTKWKYLNPLTTIPEFLLRA